MSDPSPTPAMPVPLTASAMPTDFRAGLVLFLMLEAGTYATLAACGPCRSDHPELLAWWGVLVAISAAIILGAIGLWLAGSRSRRFGWIILLAVGWLVVVTARLVPSFVLGGQGVPILLTIYVGQLTFGLMVPAAVRERRKAPA